MDGCDEVMHGVPTSSKVVAVAGIDTHFAGMNIVVTYQVLANFIFTEVEHIVTWTDLDGAKKSAIEVSLSTMAGGQVCASAAKPIMFAVPSNACV